MRHHVSHFFFAVLSGLLCLAVPAATPLAAEATPEVSGTKAQKHAAVMTLRSQAFREQGRIPVVFTCEGRDISPELRWTHVPPKTQSLAILCEDPDAPRGIWTHWVLYNLPPHVRRLAKGVPQKKAFGNGAMQGKNDFGKIGYNGPCPPRGRGAHRYFFRLFALDLLLDAAPGLTRQELLECMRDHLLARATIVGRYSR